MEIRNGVIHIKVNLKDFLEKTGKTPCCTSSEIAYEKLKKSHKSGISLNIPVQKSSHPKQKLIQKANSSNAHKPPKCERLQKTERSPKNPSTPLYKENIENLKYYHNICSIPTDLTKITSQIYSHTRSPSLNTKFSPRKPISIINNLKNS